MTMMVMLLVARLGLHAIDEGPRYEFQIVGI
jgi:hypothetical protein